jgi:hypothetical protein
MFINQISFVIHSRLNLHRITKKLKCGRKRESRGGGNVLNKLIYVPRFLSINYTQTRALDRLFLSHTITSISF